MALKALDARLAQVKQASTRTDTIAPVTTIDTAALSNNTNINNTNTVKPEDQV